MWPSRVDLKRSAYPAQTIEREDGLKKLATVNGMVEVIVAGEEDVLALSPVLGVKVHVSCGNCSIVADNLPVLKFHFGDVNVADQEYGVGAGNDAQAQLHRVPVLRAYIRQRLVVQHSQIVYSSKYSKLVLHRPGLEPPGWDWH